MHEPSKDPGNVNKLQQQLQFYMEVVFLCIAVFSNYPWSTPLFPVWFHHMNDMDHQTFRNI